MQERCISHHGHIALPPQEETCRRCPRAACVSKPIHLLRGTDPPLVVTFRCYGARESCFPQQASSGSSHLPWCCSYSLTPAEGNSLGVMRRGCSGNWDSAVSISSLLDSFGMSNTPCTRNSNTSPSASFHLTDSASPVGSRATPSKQRAAYPCRIPPQRCPCPGPARPCGTEGRLGAVLGPHWHPQTGAWLGKNSSKCISSTESTAWLG